MNPSGAAAPSNQPNKRIPQTPKGAGASTKQPLPSKAPKPGVKPVKSSSVQKPTTKAIRSQVNTDQPAGRHLEEPSASSAHRCDRCGVEYQYLANFKTHLKDCGARDREKCLYCGRTFENYAATRQHERRAHPLEYRRDLEAKLPTSESELMAKLAKVEAKSRKGVVSIRELKEATGLTEQQIRTRREKPVYQKYLDHAKKEQKEAAKTYFAPPPALTSKPSPSSPAAPKLPLRQETSSPSVAASRRIHEITKSAAVTASPEPSSGLYLSGVPRPCLAGVKRLPTSPAEGMPGPRRDWKGPTRVAHTTTRPNRTPAKKRQAPEDSPTTARAVRACTIPNLPGKKRPPERSTPPLKGDTSTSGAQLDQEPLEGPIDFQKSTTTKETSVPSTSVVISETHQDANRRLPHEVGEPTIPVPGISGGEPALLNLTPPMGDSTAISPTKQEAPIIHRSRGLSASLSNLPSIDPNNTLMDDGPEQEIRTKLQEARDQSDDSLRRLITAALLEPLEEFQSALDLAVAAVFPTREGRAWTAGGRQQEAHNSPGAALSASRRRASEYKKAQDLYVKDRTGLAERILSGKPLLEPELTPKIPEVDQHFRSIFEDESPSDDGPYTPVDSPNVYYPIAREDVELALLGWRNSSPGPDRVTIPQVRRCPIHKLVTLFNAILLRKSYPTNWKYSRTILIPKEGDRSNPANWRPITIGSAPQRLLHRILARRLAGAVSPHFHQRGFVPTDGTLANTMILESYIKGMRAKGKEYNVVSLDISKAFDTVSHYSVIRALARHRVHPAVQELIWESLRQSQTTIWIKGCSTPPVRMRRGVKQGDPLSPLLFNLVLDELLHQLNDGTHGGTIGPNTTCAAMAFADDLVLFEDKNVQMPVSLNMVEEFLRNRGMRLNAGKCAAIAAATILGKSVPRTRPVFRVSGGAIPAVADLSPLKYLGHHFTALGVAKPNIFRLVGWLSNLKRSPLKPDQKLEIMKTYLVPKLYHSLQNPAVTAGILRTCDRLLRKTTKDILHLHTHTGNQLLHARVRDGGLGLIELRTAIPAILYGRLAALAETDDPGTRAVFGNDWGRAFVQRVESLHKVPSPAQFWREKIADSPLSAGLEEVTEDLASRAWMQRKPRGWTGKDFVRAVQLRTQNLATVGIPSNPRELRGCRAGCPRVETISHVLQGCPLTHHARVARHNEVANKISGYLRKKGFPTETEPHIRHSDGQLYKPDIVVHVSDDDSVVCDVQIAWEGTRPLSQTWTDKRLVYDNIKFREAARRRWPTRQMTFLPVVIGARGVWPRCNAETAATLGFPRWLKASCVNSCLKWGSTIHNQFMAAVWKGERRHLVPERPGGRVVD